jgi:RNA polymerase sigma-70 factor (ECF subfamily)
MPRTPPGRDVLERARLGDDEAFAAIVDAHGSLVLNLAWRMVRDRQEAEDLSQEVFLHLLKVLHRYDPDRPFVPWLKRVATNLMLNRIAGKKRKMRRATASLDSFREAGGDSPPDPDADEAGESAENRERARLLRKAIRSLKPAYRAIVALRYFKGLSYEELAGDLGLPIGTVKNRLYRAREELARLLGGSL